MKLKYAICAAFIAAALAFFSVVQLANAEEPQVGFYLAPKVTYTLWTAQGIDSADFSQYRSGTGTIGGGLALGYDFFVQENLPFRIEGEFLMRGDANFPVGEENMKGQAPKTGFANFFWDFHNPTTITPYITAGAGLGFLDCQTKFAWNAGAGARLALTDNTSLDFAVKYVDFGQYDLGSYNAHLSGIETSLGLAYTF